MMTLISYTRTAEKRRRRLVAYVFIHYHCLRHLMSLFSLARVPRVKRWSSQRRQPAKRSKHFTQGVSYGSSIQPPQSPATQCRECKHSLRPETPHSSPAALSKQQQQKSIASCSRQPQQQPQAS